MKRGLDDVVDNLPRGLNGRPIVDENYRAIDGVRRQFLSELDKLNPHYALARAAYPGPAASRDAMNMGGDALSLTPDQLSVQLSNQTPGQIEQMRLGFRGGLMDAANRVRYSGNPYEATIGTPVAEQRLGLMFDGDASANVPQFLRQRDIERQMQGTANDILGNSKTAQRSIADQVFSDDGLGPALDVGVNLFTGQVPTGVVLKVLASQQLKDGIKFGVGKRAVTKADELAPMLFNPDAAANVNTIDDLLSGAALRRAYIEQSRPRRSLGMFGRGLGVSSVNYLTN